MLLLRPLAALLAVVSSVAASPLEVRASTLIQPSLDPFYRAPADLASYEPGDIIRERPVKTNVNGARTSTQVLYKTFDTLNREDVTVATIFSPLEPAPGVPKIFSTQSPQDSASFDCVPSFNILTGSTSDGTITSSGIAIATASGGLHNGWYVVLADFQGSRNGFIIGLTQGRAVLDGVRALLNHRATLPNAAGYKVMLNGYSGGANAASWAAQISSDYAPELNIVGIVSGGLPVNPKSLLISLSGGLFAGLAGGALGGFLQTYDDLNAYVKSIVTPEGEKAIAFLTSYACLPQEIIRFAFKDIFKFAVPSQEEIFANPIVSRRLAENVLGQPGAGVPSFPQYIYSGVTDEVIPNKAVTAYVEDQCERGARIEYQTDLVSEHILENIQQFLKTFAWMRDTFEGKNDNVNGCSRKDNLISLLGPLNSNAASELVGPDAISQLFAANKHRGSSGLLGL